MHTDAKRYYAVLGIDPASTDEAVRLAFRRRAKDLHPDSPSGDAGAFILLKRAYDTLADPGGRAAYDRACAPPFQPPPFQPPPERPQHYRPMPPPPMPPRAVSRRGGIGLTRYVIAFVVVAAISLGGIETMISLTEEPPSVRTRTSAHPGAAATPDPAPAQPTAAPERPSGPGSSQSGFWDPSPARGKAP